MYFNLIKNYINMLNKDDIVSFAKRENFILNNEELDIIYNAIKNRWEEIYNNGINVISEYKDKLNSNTYDKLIELHDRYKNKYLN